MTTKRELHRAIDQLSDEQVQKVIRVVEVLRADLSGAGHEVDLSRYSGVLHLTEDPLTYQQRLRSEWP